MSMTHDLDSTFPMAARSAFSVPGCRLTASGQAPEEFLGKRILIGKDPACDVVIAHPTVSRQHAEVRQTAFGYLLVDLDSTNGVFVEGFRVREVVLDRPCSFRLGEVPVSFDLCESVILPDATAKPEILGDLVGTSGRMRALFSILEQVAPTDATVLVLGETGTGKEVAARTLHKLSCRKGKPFVVVDCSSIPAALIESELFGHEKGAFSGATHVRKGLLEAADGGTVFLDEVGELPLELQPRLLRFLELGEIRRVGASGTLRVDVRVVAATNRDLLAEVRQGRFREDLYYRLDVVCVVMPALRHRPDDIPALVQHVLAHHEFNRFPDGSLRVQSIARESLDQLARHSFPGNVRELLNCLRRAVALAGPHPVAQLRLPSVGSAAADETPMGCAPHGVLLSGGASSHPSEPVSCPIHEFHVAKERAMDEFEAEYLATVLRQSGNNLSQAARTANVDRKHFRQLLKKHGLYDPLP
jgi:transcriptional regulator with GAF, ATPase, and Fis domain